MGILRKLGMVAASAAATFVLAECAFRVFGVSEEEQGKIDDLREFLQNGHHLFTPWAYSGYTVKDHSSEDRTRPKDWQFELVDDPQTLRVSCLGGSTTHGGYPLILLKQLEKRRRKPVKVMNWGVPGYTSAESMVNYFTNVQDYGSDVLVIHHALNDVSARRISDFRHDYSTFRHPWREFEMPTWERWLVATSDLYASLEARDPKPFLLKAFVETYGVKRISRDAPGSKLQEGTEAPFRRNLTAIIEHAQARGTRVVLMTMPHRPSAVKPAKDGSEPVWIVGLEEHNAIVRELAEAHDCLLVDAAQWTTDDPEKCERIFNDHVHVTSQGMLAKAQMIVDALEGAGWLEPRASGRPVMRASP